MATVLAQDRLIAVSTGNSAVIWNSESEQVKVIEQPRLQDSSSEKPCKAKSNKLPRKGETSSEHEERHMACIALSQCGKWLALASSRGQKQLGLWRTHDWVLESARPMSRAASCVRFTSSSSALVVADKAGDVYLYSVEEPMKEKEWLLGHIAMLLDVVVTQDEKFIITCDRDEKIRVSCFPNAYNINGYCLGHDMFVTSLCLLPHNSAVLVSTSGDGTVRLWDYVSGRQLLCVDMQEILNPDAPKDENPLPIKSCASMQLDNSTSLLCVCIGGESSCCVLRVSEGSSEGWQATLLQRLCVGAELWSAALTLSGLLVTLSRSQLDTVAVWQWQVEQSAFTRSTHTNLQPINNLWDSNLQSCFTNPSVPSLLYRRKYADDVDKAVPTERPVKILKN